MKKVVMAFGTFDGLHEGHAAFLRQARRRGDYLVAVVAPDAAVLALKGKLPRSKVAERIRALKASGWCDAAVAGDRRQGGWNIIKKIRPDIIALGYDQKELKKNLLGRISSFPKKPKLCIMKPYRPRAIHTSFME